MIVMINLILKFEELFDSYFGNVPDSFNGEYHSKNKELNEMMNDIYNEEKIPSARDDRKNLKSDGSNIASDLGVAYEKYKEKYTI